MNPAEALRFYIRKVLEAIDVSTTSDKKSNKPPPQTLTLHLPLDAQQVLVFIIANSNSSVRPDAAAPSDLDGPKVTNEDARIRIVEHQGELSSSTVLVIDEWGGSKTCHKDNENPDGRPDTVVVDVSEHGGKLLTAIDPALNDSEDMVLEDDDGSWSPSTANTDSDDGNWSPSTSNTDSDDGNWSPSTANNDGDDDTDTTPTRHSFRREVAPRYSDLSRKRHQAAPHLFKCEDCGMTFNDKLTIDAHSCKGSDSSYFICKFCEKKFTDLTKFWHHYRSHACNNSQPVKTREEPASNGNSHPNLPWECADCEEKYRLRDELRAHRRAEHPPKPTCMKCKEEFLTEEKLAAHRESAHPPLQEGRHKCVDCRQTFMTQEFLKTHCEEVGHVSHVQCSACDEKFSSRSELQKHQCTTRQMKNYCQECTEGFATKEEVVQHQESAHGIKHECQKNEKNLPEKALTAASPSDLEGPKVTNEDSQIWIIEQQGERNSSTVLVMDEWDGSKSYDKDVENPDGKLGTVGVDGLEHGIKLPMAMDPALIDSEDMFLEDDDHNGNCSPGSVNDDSDIGGNDTNTIRTSQSCKRKLATQYDVLSRKRRQAAPYTFKCEDCDRTFDDESAIDVHACKGSDSPYFICKFCDKLFTDRNEFWLHYLSHFPNNRMRHQPVKTREETESDRHSRSSIRWECADCEEMYLLRDELRAHRREAHPPKATCMKCQAEFSTEEELAAHQESAHPAMQEGGHKCVDYPQTFTTLEFLKTHCEEVGHVSHVQSPACDEQLSSQNELSKHKRATHQMKNYCQKCTEVFATKEEAVEHQELAHGVKHECEKMLEEGLAAAPSDLERPRVTNEDAQVCIIEQQGERISSTDLVMDERGGFKPCDKERENPNRRPDIVGADVSQHGGKTPTVIELALIESEDMFLVDDHDEKNWSPSATDDDSGNSNVDSTPARQSFKRELSTRYGEFSRKHCRATPYTFKCEECGMTFDDESAIDVHSCQGYISPYFICKFCGKKFTDRNEFWHHYRSHVLNNREHCDPDKTKEEPASDGNSGPNLRWECTDCEERYRRRDELRAHKREVHPPKPTCMKCKEEFSTKEALATHQESAHPPIQEGRHKCVDCPQTFTTLEFLKAHCEEVGHVSHVQCSACDEKFSSRTELRKHKRTTHRMKNYCQKCTEIFATKEEVVEHRELAHGIKHKCRECEKKFADKHSLLKHKRKNHPKLNTHICVLCKKVFAKESELKMHQAQHLGNNTTKVKDATKEDVQHKELVHGKNQECEKKVVEKGLAVAPSDLEGPKVTNEDSQIRIIEQQGECSSSTVMVINEWSGSKLYDKASENVKGRLDNVLVDVSEHGSKLSTAVDPPLINSEYSDNGNCSLVTVDDDGGDGIGDEGTTATRQSFTRELATQCSDISRKCLRAAPQEFKCNDCELTYDDESTIDVHSCKGPDPSYHICKFCGKKCTDQDEFWQHYRSHTYNNRKGSQPLETKEESASDGNSCPNLPWECTDCKERYRLHNELRDHMCEIHPPKLTCMKCKEEFSTKEEVVTHRESAHPPIQEGGHKCVDCPQMFTTLEFLKAHCEEVGHVSHVQCSACDEEFSSRNELSKHQRITHQMKNYCQKSTEVFATEEEVVEHQELVHGIKHGYQKCEKNVLEKGLAAAASDLEEPKITNEDARIRIIEHQEERHNSSVLVMDERGGSKPCDKEKEDPNGTVGFDVSELPTTIDPALIDSEDMFLEDDDDGNTSPRATDNDSGNNNANTTPTNRSFKRGLAARYSELPKKHGWAAPYTFKCEDCDMTFDDEAAIDVHSCKGSGSRYFICKICGKKFTARNEYWYHYRSHAYDNRYHHQPVKKKEEAANNCPMEITGNNCPDLRWKCADCEERYRLRDELRAHKRTAHPPTPTCMKCRKAFSSKDELAAHRESSHPPIQEGGHKCIDCRQTFTTLEFLKTHFEEAGHVSHVQCTACGEKFSSRTELRMHQRTTHQMKNYCQKCTEGFATEEETVEHQQLVHGIKHGLQECEKNVRENRVIAVPPSDLEGPKVTNENAQIRIIEQQEGGSSSTALVIDEWGGSKPHDKVEEIAEGRLDNVLVDVSKACNKLPMAVDPTFSGSEEVLLEDGDGGNWSPDDDSGDGYNNADTTPTRRSFKKRQGTRYGRQAAQNAFKCEDCDMKFDDESAIDVHSCKGSGSRYFICKFCRKEFTDRNEYWYHYQSHACDNRYHHQPVKAVEEPVSNGNSCPNLRWKCTDCEKGYRLRDELRAHKHEVHPPKPTCMKCKEEFQTKEELATHQESAHPPIQEGRHKCVNCPHFFTTLEFLKTHCEEVGHVSHVQCSACDEKFSSRTELRNHIRTTHQLKNYCLKCTEVFATKEEVVEHRELVHGIKHKCRECEKKFADKRSLLKHKRKIHSKLKTHICVLCEKLFAKESELKMHQAQHLRNNATNVKDVYDEEEEDMNENGVNEKKYECKRCKCLFVNRLTFQKHNVITHGDCLFACGVCDFVLQTRKDLLKHKETHMEKIVCEQCGRQYRHKRSLLRHMPVHSDERPFLYSMCKFQLQAKDRLKTHQATYEEKHYLCDLCPMKFSDGQQLRHHQKSHAYKQDQRVNNLIFRCLICPSIFDSSTHLQQHYNTEHPLGEFRCVECNNRVSNFDMLKIHFRSKHEGKMLHCCRVCGDVFDKKEKFLIHRNRTHKVPKRHPIIIDTLTTCNANDKTFQSNIEFVVVI